MKAHWFGALVIIAAAPLQAADERSDAVQTWVEANVPEMMRAARLPGFAIAVVRDGETIYTDVFGARDLAKNLPVTTDTLFGIGSITKSFVAISILQLAEQGKLTLDDPVSKHLPFKLGKPGEPILIRHFLTHSSGFPSLRGFGEDASIPISSADDFFRFVNGASSEIAFLPGEHFFYNNGAYQMLGAIIQEVSGMPFHEYVTENVIRPLGMKRSTFNVDQFNADPDHITPYLKNADGNEPTDFPFPNPEHNPSYSFRSAAGGITTSVTEMSRYANMLIEQGRYPGGQLISQRSMREMQRIHIREPDGYYGITGYGFGLRVTPNFLGEALIDHGGRVVSTARISFLPSEKIGIVMMGNSDGMYRDYPLIAEAVLAILMGKDPETAIPVLGIRRRMEQLEGSYATYRNLLTLDIVNDGGLMYLKRGRNGSPVPLIPEDPTYRVLDFYTLTDGKKSPINARINDEGQISVLMGRYVYHKKF